MGMGTIIVAAQFGQFVKILLGKQPAHRLCEVFLSRAFHAQNGLAKFAVISAQRHDGVEQQGWFLAPRTSACLVSFL